METVKKHKIMVVGLLAAMILGIVTLIAIASTEKPVAGCALLQSAPIVANQEMEACPANCVKPCCNAENGVKACEMNCEKQSCTAKNAEEKVKTCPLSTPKSCCNKN